MKAFGEKMKRFLLAEEVPRWFGLSVVLIYLAGLGAVTHFGVWGARRESAALVQKTASYGVRLLAKQLSAIVTDGSAKQDQPAPDVVFRRELRDFAANVNVESLRVVDAAGTILASLDPEELGTSVAHDAHDLSMVRWSDVIDADRADAGAASACKLLRVPFSRSQQTLAPSSPNVPVDGTAGAPSEPPTPSRPVLYVEAKLPAAPHGAASLADHARILAVVLVALGALFVVYRCLRGQMRGVALVAERLRSQKEKIGEDLESLHIADAADQVATAWNQLVDLTQRLSRTVARSSADHELMQALEKSGGGALAEALDCIPDGLLYITDEERFEYVNAAACRLLGWQRRDGALTCDQTLSDASAEGVGARILDYVRGARQPGGSFKTRSEVLGTDDADGGNSYRVTVIALPGTRRSGECVVVIRDVSQQVRAEQAREEFTTQVTHELRTPLTNIRAYAETLSSGMFEDPSVVTECYNVITKETRRLSRLIEDILSVSQLEVGSIELQIDQVDLKTLLNEGIRDVRGLADEKNIDLQLVLPSKLEPVRGDRDKLAVVINNLLGNAIKYTAADGNVVVGCQCATDEITITVKDNGVGIDPSEHARVFEKFQRSLDPDVQKETGTGIGLYTAREIVRHHHGDIDLVSEKGQGSTFLVRLPREATRATTLSTTGET